MGGGGCLVDTTYELYQYPGAIINISIFHKTHKLLFESTATQLDYTHRPDPSGGLACETRQPANWPIYYDCEENVNLHPVVSIQTPVLCQPRHVKVKGPHLRLSP